MTYFFKWFIFFIVTISTLILSQIFFGTLSFIWYTDATYISWIILGIFVYVNMLIAKKTYGLDNNIKFDHYETKIEWFWSEACMGLGMIGTVIGVIIVLNSGFADIDLTISSDVKEVLGEMALGYGSALITTLVGLLTSLILKRQLTLLEHQNEE